jgi:hypothetical protein
MTAGIPFFNQEPKVPIRHKNTPDRAGILRDRLSQSESNGPMIPFPYTVSGGVSVQARIRPTRAIAAIDAVR